VFERIGHLAISSSSIWRRKEAWGEQFQALESAQQEEANVFSRASQFRARALGSQRRLGVSMDGTMVYIRDEGWKELKVGCTFEIAVQPTWNKETQEWEELAHAVNNDYVAHLGGPEVLGELLWAQARQRGWESAKDKQVIGDGAAWVWNSAQDYFYDARQTVDWYHAVEHLAHAATLLHGEATSAAKRWFKAAQTVLFQGHAERLALELNRLAADYPAAVAEALRKEAGYLDTHKRRMQYMELREEGFVLGSGMVESGAKRFKSRFCGAGMRWNRDGIKRLIPIRAAIMGGRFDSMWQLAYNLPQN
jgi:hypothetical protein